MSTLTGENADMTVYQLDQLGEPANGPVQQELEKIIGVISVPQVFVDGKFFGVGGDVEELKAAGTVKSKLTELGGSFER